MRYRMFLIVVASAGLLALILLRLSSAPANQAAHLPAGAEGRATPVASSIPATPTLLNPAIDMQGYLDIADEAAVHRERRRLSEAEFLRMAAEPGTIILDARSAERYGELHVKGAINLSFPDMTIDSLHQAIPDKSTRVLIYCNNNFLNEEQAFPSKLATASLNISTYIALYTYGYRNIYELGPLIDIDASILEFERGRPN